MNQRVISAVFVLLLPAVPSAAQPLAPAWSETGVYAVGLGNVDDDPSLEFLATDTDSKTRIFDMLTGNEEYLMPDAWNGSIPRSRDA